MKGKFFLSLVIFSLSGCNIVWDKSMKEKIDEIIETGPFNGVVMIYQANIPLYIRAYGFSDIEKKIPLRIDDQFMIGSITKQITAMTVLKFIPNLHSSALNISCPATFHELLNHTAGVNDEDENDNSLTKGQFCYSSKGYTLLAEALEEQTKKTFDTCIETVYKDAGMYHTGVQPQGTQMTYSKLKKIFPRLVKSYYNGETEQYTQSSPRDLFKNAAGGLISTAKDLILWNEALHEKQVWGKDKTQLLLTPRINFHHRWGKISYGYGIQLVKEKSTEYSHTGVVRGFISTLLYYPDTKLHVVILENTSWKTLQESTDFTRHDAIRSVVRNKFSL